MTKPSNIAIIENATGITWEEWVLRLSSLDADKKTHPEIAEQAYKILKPLQKEINIGWWAQNITVAYEQHIGRRQPGQQRDGTYEVSVSKTFALPASKVMKLWSATVLKHEDFNGLVLAGEPRSSVTEKWLNWRADLSDGSKLVVGIPNTSHPKTKLGFAHSKMQVAEDMEAWRPFWKAFLNQL